MKQRVCTALTCNRSDILCVGFAKICELDSENKNITKKKKKWHFSTCNWLFWSFVWNEFGAVKWITFRFMFHFILHWQDALGRKKRGCQNTLRKQFFSIFFFFLSCSEFLIHFARHYTFNVSFIIINIIIACLVIASLQMDANKRWMRLFSIIYS